MAKRIIKDLRPNDSVWTLYGGTIEEHKIYSISTDEISTTRKFKAKINVEDFTAWCFEAESTYNSKRTFYLNKIDVLKLKHAELEEDLKSTYLKQQSYFDSILAKNKAIYESNLEIINELKT